jgi:hypothetical protein
MHNEVLKNQISTYFDGLATNLLENVLINSETSFHQNYFEHINEKLQPILDVSEVLKETLDAPLLRSFFVDTFSVFSDCLTNKQCLNKKSALQITVYLANFLTRKTLIYYGDFFDIISSIFEVCIVTYS